MNDSPSTKMADAPKREMSEMVSGLTIRLPPDEEPIVGKGKMSTNGNGEGHEAMAAGQP